MKLPIARLLAPLCIAILLTIPARAADLYKPGPGPYTVKTVDETWTDPARSREIPVRMFLPQPAAGATDKAAKHPVIVFSHGWGGSRTGYGNFGQHMASNGYIVILPTHAGSDTAAIRPPRISEGPRLAPGPWMMKSLNDPENLTNRPKDISYIISQLTVNPLLRDAADATRVGVAGHSFGAYTAMAIGGMKVELPEAPVQNFRDPRVKAVLPMSPEGTGTMGIADGAWDSFAAPVLFMTGTKDYGQGNRSATWRRTAFEHVSGVDNYLIILDGATHMTFGHPGGALDGGMAGDAAMRERHAALVNSISSAFFDAYVMDDTKAREWLRAFFDTKHSDCTAEFKPAPASAPK